MHYIFKLEKLNIDMLQYYIINDLPKYCQNSNTDSKETDQNVRIKVHVTYLMSFK